MSNSSTVGDPKKAYHVTTEQLPISCPTKEDSLWNQHPRVFLPLNEKNREEICPYCSAKFVLQS